MLAEKVQKRITRHKRITSEIQGTSSRPRLAVYKSNKYLSAQLIDDEAHNTIASVSTKKSGTVEKAAQELAAAASKAKIESVVFDRGGFLFTGKIKKFADSAREAGLKF